MPFEELSRSVPAEQSVEIRHRVIRAREVQQIRYESHPGVFCNAQLTPALLHRYAEPDAQGLQLLKEAMRRFNLSARAYDRILKVARTVADLEGSRTVQMPHLAEAIGYRNLDRESWAG